MEFFSAIYHECAANAFIPSPFIKQGMTVSHLLFADDVLLFVKASILKARNIKSFLMNFKDQSSLGRNWEKHNLFVSNCSADESGVYLCGAWY